MKEPTDNKSDSGDNPRGGKAFFQEKREAKEVSGRKQYCGRTFKRSRLPNWERRTGAICQDHRAPRIVCKYTFQEWCLHQEMSYEVKGGEARGTSTSQQSYNT